MRTHISKGIFRRSKAIRTVLEQYNALAVKQRPRRPTIDMKQITQYGWMCDFDLLKTSRHDVLAKAWANPLHRQQSRDFFQLKCAEQELIRLNVEIDRLASWVDEEDADLLNRWKTVEVENPPLASAIRRLYEERSRVNDLHRGTLTSIYRLPGYTGEAKTTWDTVVSGEDVDEDDVDADDTVLATANRLGEFFDGGADDTIAT